MAIRTVIFDIGRTLIPFDMTRIESQPAERREALRHLGRQFEVGGIASGEFRRRLRGLTGLAEAEMVDWWCSIFSQSWLIDPALVKRVQQRYRCGLLSNTNALHMEHLRRQYPLLNEFAFQTLSYEVGAAKPAAAIYAAAEAAAQCPPEEIFYLDDVPEFVAAARARGWRAEQAGDAALEVQLARHGIRI